MRSPVSFCALLVAAALAALPAFAQEDVISTAIGGGPDDIPALQSDLVAPAAVVLGSSGTYYFSACNQNRVYKVNAAGTLTVVAGLGVAGYAGDGVAGGAADALLNCPTGVEVDSSGNVYISDYYNQVVRKVDTTSTITTIAGVQGACGYNGDGTPATNYHLCYPRGLALDSKGDLFIADGNDCRIRQLVLATDTISTYAGTGSCGFSGDSGPAVSADLSYPAAVAIDGSGNAYIADTSNYRIREVNHTTGIITTIAGTGTYGFSGDGGPALLAEFSYIYDEALAVNSAGTKVTLSDYNNLRVRQFTVGGNINTIAGSGSGGFCGDDGPPLNACLNGPQGVAITASGSVYVVDTNNNRVRLFTSTVINTVAGNGLTTPTLVSGVPAPGVVLNYPFAVLEDPSKDVFVTDTNNCLVRELVRSAGVVDFFAGTTTCGYSGDGAPATSAEVSRTYGLARDPSGNIYIADTQNCIIREVNTAGDISTFAGTPRVCGFSGDGGPATSAELYYPYGVYADTKGDVYIADSSNQRIRKVSGGTITTFAGNGVSGFLGDGDPAVTAELRTPYGVSGDGAGNVYIADTSNCRVREVAATTAVITTVAGNGACGFSGDGLAVENDLNYPDGVRADVNGNLFISDTNNQRLRWVDLRGNMTTFAGTGSAGLSGDGGPATAAELYYPSSIDVDSSGNFLVADQYNFRIRGITAFTALNTSSSSLTFGTVPLGSTGVPETLTLSAVGPVTISNIFVTGADFTEYDDCGSSLTNGATCTVAVYFTPKAAGARSGTLTIQDNGYFRDFTVINLAGTGSAITVTGGPLNFGNQVVKTTSAPKSVTVSNDGTTAITFGTITVNEADFAISSNTCPASGKTLAAKASCTISVTFKPASTGAKKGALIIKNSDPTSPQFVGLTGTGTSSVALSPGSLTFASEPVGVTSSPSKVTLTNNSGTTLTLGSPALSVTGPFAIVTHETSCTNGLPIASGGNCFILLTFTPTSVGFPSGVLSVTDSDSTSPQTVALSGAGTAVKFTPASVSFGAINVGTQVSSTVTITNVGGTTIQFTAGSILGTNKNDFSTNAGDPPCSGSLIAGAACTFTVYFKPSIVGAETATYEVFDNSPGTPQGLPLTGTGQ